MQQSNYTLNPQNQLAPRIYKTKLSGLYYLDNQPVLDERGYFVDLANLALLRQLTQHDFVIKQVNLSRSYERVIRGIHAENWNKLVTITSGQAYCAICDLDPNSPTFAQVETFVLGKQAPALTGSLYISAGLGNSICVTEGPVDYVYLVDQLYAERDPQGDRAINLFDPTLNINWPIPRQDMVISERDQNSISLAQLYPEAVRALSTNA